MLRLLRLPLSRKSCECFLRRWAKIGGLLLRLHSRQTPRKRTLRRSQVHCLRTRNVTRITSRHGLRCHLGKIRQYFSGTRAKVRRWLLGELNVRSAHVS